MKRLFVLLTAFAMLATAELRVNGRHVGDVESDGDVRLHGSLVGRFEKDGDIRVKGSLTGRIEPDGTIRKHGSICGSAKGVSVPQAAVLFFFDFFSL